MIDQELKQRALTPATKGEAAPREKILKLGKKITDVVDHKLGKVRAEDAEYWGLAGVVTDEMADIALTMKLRTPYTVEELWKMNKVTEEQKPHFQELLDQMSYIGLLEYDYGYHYDHNGRTAPPSERRYILPMFVPGSAELFNMEEDAELSGRNPRLEQHPELAKFFERMTYVPLAGKTHLLPPGGGGVGMHVIPVEKAISMENQTLDIEHLSYWLKKYEGHIGVGQCSCRTSRAVLGEGCADDNMCWCIGVGDFADYCRETGKGHDITYEEAMHILQAAEDNGFVHQITNIDGENKIFGICNCNVNICNALRTSQLFNTPNLSRSAYTAEVDRAKCVACGKCVEYCPAGAVKLGQKLCTKQGEIKYPKHELPDNLSWGPDKWDEDYRDNNRINCYDTGTAPCKTACPAHIAVQGYLKMAAQGRYTEALALIKKDNPLPAICGRICNRRCEDACTRGSIDQAIAIDEVKKFIAQQDLDAETRYIPKKVVPSLNGSFSEKVAIIGAGPAGLSCAFYLAEKGYSPVIFEKNEKPGGMLRYGIPSFKLEKDVIDAEIDIIKAMGVEIKCGIEVGKDVTLDELRAQGYKAFYIAIGCQGGRKAGIPGEDAEGVMTAVDFLRTVGADESYPVTGKAVVVGGGNVAIDVARTAQRCGAESVAMFCLEPRDKMPASEEEIAEALEEDVTIDCGWGPKEILTENGRVTGIVFKRCVSVWDKDGKFAPAYDENDTKTVPCDRVFLSIGQSILWGDLLKGSKVELGRGNGAVADSLTYQTAEPDIFVGGDVYTGPKFAIDAIAAGREGAISIHRFVQPHSSLTIGRREFIALDKDNIKVEQYDNASRQIPGTRKDVDHKKSFRDAKLPFTEEQVKAETARCLGCGASVVDPNKCIGCGVCTTKCEFGAIKLHRERPECSNMIPSEKKLPYVLGNGAKQALKIKFSKKKEQ